MTFKSCYEATIIVNFANIWFNCDLKLPDCIQSIWISRSDLTANYFYKQLEPFFLRGKNNKSLTEKKSLTEVIVCISYRALVINWDHDIITLRRPDHLFMKVLAAIWKENIKTENHLSLVWIPLQFWRSNLKHIAKEKC